MFDDIKTRLQTTFAQVTGIAPHFDIAADHIRLIKPLKLATIADFFTQIFGTAAALPDMPFGQSRIEHFLLERAIAAADIPTRVEIRVSFKGATWTAAHGLELALIETSLDFWGDSITGSISGSVTVKDVEFDATIAWPSLVVNGYMAAKPAIAHDPLTLVQAHGLGAPGAASGGRVPKLHTLVLNAAPRMHQIAIEVGASDLCSIGPVHLDTLSLSFEYAGGLQAEFTGSIAAEFSAANLAFAAEGAKTHEGWTVAASAAATSTVGAVVDALAAHWFPAIANTFADSGVPDELAKLPVVGNVSMTASTADRHVTITAGVNLSNGKGILLFEIDVAPESLVVKATLHFDDLDFQVAFEKTSTMTLLAAQFKSEHPLTVRLADLVDMAHLDGASSTLPVGVDVTIGIRDVLIAMASSAAPGSSHYLAAADIEGGINLSGLGDLPIIGTLMPRDLSLRLSLAPVLITQHWDKEQADLEKLRGDGGPHLPETLKSSSLGVSLQLPGKNIPVNMGLSLGSTTTGDDVVVDTPAPTGGGAPAKSPLTWKTINKALGPVSIERIGLGLDKTRPADPTVRVLLDSSLGLGPLSLSLVGFGAHYGLKSKKLGVELHGMGIDFKKPPLEIGGGFAKIETTRNGKTTTDYLGKVNLKLKTIGIAASGGFTTIDGTPSMFVYGVLTTPLGGPPFFFVEGLAAGFGFNRKLTVPALGKIHTFPLVADAINVADGKDAPTMSEALQSLATYVQPVLGEYFLAAGIKFTSFKLIDSFLLVIVSAGRDLKIDAVGISHYQSPPLISSSLPAMVKIELEISGAVRPAEGFVRVQASLTKNSYVYSPLVQLSGGFAFQAWFSGPHAGDFVVSAGGYHPDFKRPAHYPKVKRIALTFKVPHVEVFIKGQAYFALTPSMLMAGGSLEAVAKFGKVHASFMLYAHFRLQWEPYHYDFTTGISIKARWWKFSTHASAQLHIWGPEFTGYAKVHWSVISFDVSFGSSLPWPLPISWSHFQNSFLPHEIPAGTTKPVAKVAPTLSITGGEVSVIDGVNGPVHIVNPKELVISIDSVLPMATVTTQAGGTSKVDRVKLGGKPVIIGCGPIGVATIVSSDLLLAFSGSNDFTHQIKTKEFPAAMWGKPAQSGKPSVNDPRTITAGGSVELRLSKAIKHRGKQKILRTDFAYHVKRTSRVSAVTDFAFVQGSKPLASVLTRPTRKVVKARNEVLTSIGVSTERSGLRPEFISALRGKPTTMVLK